MTLINNVIYKSLTGTNIVIINNVFCIISTNIVIMNNVICFSIMSTYIVIMKNEICIFICICSII